MVTMQQIADRCGVSRGTVDRALHHKEGVREEVAERIRATAREMGYISNRLVMQQTQQWKIGVVLHSGHSPFVQMLCELFESFSERELLPNITVIVRAMQDTDVQHQLTLIDELVTTEHIDGLALMPLANTLVRHDHISFRTAHEIVAEVVNRMIAGNLKADETGLAVIAPVFREVVGRETTLTEDDVRSGLDPERIAMAKRVTGGTAPDEVERQLESRLRSIDADEAELAHRVQRVAMAKTKLEREVRAAIG